MLRFMGLQRVRHDERLNGTELTLSFPFFEGTNPIMRAPSSLSNLTLATSQGPTSKYHYGGSRLQYTNFGETRSVHRN